MNVSLTVPSLHISKVCLLNHILFLILSPTQKGRVHHQRWVGAWWLRLGCLAVELPFWEFSWNATCLVGKLTCNRFLLPEFVYLDISFVPPLPNLLGVGCKSRSGTPGVVPFSPGCSRSCQSSIFSFDCGWVCLLVSLFPIHLLYFEPLCSLAPSQGPEFAWHCQVE